MKHLYFIGNGFDLHHDFKTRYTDFRDWLKGYNREAYENILNLYGVKDDKSNETWDWWSYFEVHLVDMDVYEDILDIVKENQIDYGAENFHEADRYDGAVEAEMKFEATMNVVLASFGEWIDSLGKLKSQKEVDLDKNADFITFNYTLTLEEQYEIAKEMVHHFHGKLGEDKYILGHGRTYRDIRDKIKENEEKPIGVAEEELHDWYADQWDEAYENTVNATASKFASYKKNVEMVISENEELYKKMGDLEKITIFGFSFSTIDNPYISEAIKRAKNKDTLEFVVTWHSATDLKNIDNFFTKEGIKQSQVNKIQLDTITTLKNAKK